MSPVVKHQTITANFIAEGISVRYFATIRHILLPVRCSNTSESDPDVLKSYSFFLI
jgi:hypothetical protein